MCGIAGIFAYGDAADLVSAEELFRVREAMSYRGPDGAGSWLSEDGRVGLAHRRLTIIDLTDAGAQPMSTADGRYHITFNGEIYNYRALREDLASRGYRFHSASDTEVLLHLYADKREAMVHALRGMYAFGIWDNVEKTLFLARDPFGIKPLYYAHDGRTLRFASQVKALLKSGNIDTTPEAAGHVGFFVLGSVPEPYTLYRNIRSVPAGSTLSLSLRGRPRLEAFFDIAREFEAAGEGPQITAEEQQEWIAAALRDSVNHHMVADVPVGLFLSSGLDSTTLAAFATEAQHAKLHTVTLGFREYAGTDDDETPLAALVASQYHTTHQTSWMTKRDFEADLEELLDRMDQPSIDGVNTYFVSKAARQGGMKVALSGVGGDELFGGYPSFREVPRLVNALSRARWITGLGKSVRRLVAPMLGAKVSPKYASVLEYGATYGGAYLLRRALYMPWEVPGLLDDDTFKEGWEKLDLFARLEACTGQLRNARQRVSALEMSWYMRNQLLRDADWAGMAHSLEIRVPLVDIGFFRALAPLLATANPPTKTEMARTPARPLPPRLILRPKSGFLTPVPQWLAGSHASHTEGVRRWARRVNPPRRKIRTLALIADAYGAHGGIGLYNRDLLESLCSFPDSTEVVALPRLVTGPLGKLPAKLTYVTEGANSKLQYVLTLVKLLWSGKRFDLLVCAHINLLPLAWLARLRLRAPLVLIIYGVDAWSSQGALKKSMLRKVDRLISISDVTRRKFQDWAGIDENRVSILPNAIHLDWYGAGPADPGLLQRYGLDSHKVLLTVGRLVSAERYKGFDEVLDLMPSLLKEMPDVLYMIVGDGSDKERLKTKAAELGLNDRVIFTGLVPESEKADHYRLAHAYVMPSRGEGFGFVLLEAMACGIPVVASKLDGTREAVREGSLGVLVDPDDPRDILRGIRSALESERGLIPAGLHYFAFPNFESHVHRLVREIRAV